MFAWRRTAARRRVVVNLRSGTVLRGVLWQRRGSLLVLKDAAIIADRGTRLPEAVKMDGEAIIERDSVDFVQVA